MQFIDTIANISCIYKKTNKQLSQIYPFNTADKIVVVNYPYRKDSYTNDNLIVNDSFIVKGISKVVTIENRQIDTLFSILYDYEGNAGFAADCYNPRHSVIFYKDNKAIAFFEVCLECGGFRKSKNANFGNFCDETICRFQKFFKELGINESEIDGRCK